MATPAIPKPGTRKARAGKTGRKFPNPTPRLSTSKQALSQLELVAVAYSQVEREWFPTEEAYVAELEVEERAREVAAEVEKLGIRAKCYPGDAHFLTSLLVDRPDLVINLVDTLRGKDSLQTTIPGALELVGIPYTGAGMQGLVIGNDRHLIKQLLQANEIPTPPFQYIQRRGSRIDSELGFPVIVKLNESGGSVGIDNNAVKETAKQAEEQVDRMLGTYRVPVVVERFVDGPEITAVVFDDGRRRHVFLGQKKFHSSPDGKHYFTSLESYAESGYSYVPVRDENLAAKIENLCVRAFRVLHNKDYAKFDIRVEEQTGTPFFTDCNPNTAFGPNMGLPFTEVLAVLYGVTFEKVLASLLSKYAKKIKTKD